jgi:hypothetical protein
MVIPEQNPQQDIGAGKRFARSKIRPASHFLEVPEQMPKFLPAFCSSAAMTRMRTSHRALSNQFERTLFENSLRACDQRHTISHYET